MWVQEETKSESEGWTRYIKRMVIDFPDRDVAAYDKAGPIDVRLHSPVFGTLLT